MLMMPKMFLQFLPTRRALALHSGRQLKVCISVHFPTFAFIFCFEFYIPCSAGKEERQHTRYRCTREGEWGALTFFCTPFDLASSLSFSGLQASSHAGATSRRINIFGGDFF